MPRREEIILPTTQKMIERVRYALYQEYNKIRSELLEEVKARWRVTSAFIPDKYDPVNLDRRYWSAVAQALRATYTNDPKSEVWTSFIGIPKTDPHAPLAIFYEWGTGIHADPTNPFYNPSEDPDRNAVRGPEINAPIVGRPGGMQKWKVGPGGNPYHTMGAAKYTQRHSSAFERYSRGSYYTSDPLTTQHLNWNKFYGYIGGKGIIATHWFRGAVRDYLSQNDISERLVKVVRREMVVSKYLQVRSYSSVV